MVRPAGGISVPQEQFFEDIPYRYPDPNPVNIQHEILGDIDPDPLHDPVTVVLFFRGSRELDQSGNLRTMKEEKPNV